MVGDDILSIIKIKPNTEAYMDKKKIYRQFKGLTISELAKKYNLKEETIKDILKDSRGSASAIELAKKYGVSRQWIYQIVKGLDN